MDECLRTDVERLEEGLKLLVAPSTTHP